MVVLCFSDYKTYSLHGFLYPFTLPSSLADISCLCIPSNILKSSLFEEPIGFPGGLDGKECACNAGDPGLIPGSERSPEEVNGNPFQDSCLENSMDRGAWQATVHGVTKSWTQLSDYHCTYCLHLLIFLASENSEA